AVDVIGVAALLDRGTELVPLRERDPRNGARNAHHILLVNDDPVRVLQELSKRWVEVLRRLLARLSADVSLLGSARRRAGADDRHGRDAVSDIPCLDLGKEGAHRGAFELKAAEGARRLEDLNGFWVLVGDIGELERNSVRLDVVEGLLKLGEAAIA